jgi:hypothetical protein
MNGTTDNLDRWYLSGPLGVGTAFDEPTDAHSALSVSWAGVGSAIRHGGPDALSLLDARPADANQGPNLSWWGLNAGGKATRLGVITSRFATTADGGASSYIAFHTKSPGGDVAEALRITGTGNVGIGATTPGARLSVVVPGASEIGMAARSATMLTSSGSLGAAAGSELALASLGFHSGNNTSLGIRAYRTDDGDGWPTAAIGLGMDVDDTVRAGATLWLHANGNVGIGTTTPRAKLHVNGGAIVSGVTIGTKVGGINTEFEYESIGVNDTRMNLRLQSPNAIVFHTGNPLKSSMIITPSGNVGIGMTNPGVRLEVSGDIRLGGGNVQVSGDIRLDGNRTISAPGRLHITGDELLYVLNRNGMVIGKEWGGTGDLEVQGLIGVAGQSPTPRTPGWGGGIHTWDLEVEGSAWCRNRWETGARDLAENYRSEDALEPGEIVCFHPAHDSVVRSAAPNDSMVCGVVSTAPGVLLNSDPDSDDRGKLFPIALCGRTPCRAVDENGPIRRGDLLTSSSRPGHAMRAEPILVDGRPVYQAGTILGKALSALEADAGVIEMFIIPG